MDDDNLNIIKMILEFIQSIRPSRRWAAQYEVEHSGLSRDGLGRHGRICICIYRPRKEERWSCVVFDGDCLIDVCTNAFATDVQASLSAHLRLAEKRLLVEDGPE